MSEAGPSAWTSGRRPGLLGQALMLYAVDVAPEDTARFAVWYVHEHLPERVAVPGFLRGRRYVRIDGPGQQHLTLYDARDTAVFSSPEYLARLDDPTPLTREVVRTFRRPHRAVLSVLFSHGATTGRRLAMLQLPAADPAQLHRWVEDDLAPTVLTHPDVYGLHLAVVDAGATAAKSATAEGRDAAEEVDEACVLLVDGTDVVGEAARRAAARCAELGFTEAPPDATVYELVVTLLPTG
ncbi:hypothetical protein [Blastococcus deserti]|uniref:Uncharacterized protein n=1 Tax=Blastococcus deserti TaxID=2259033 RepID=A0ABW4XGZ7_9ACTN